MSNVRRRIRILHVLYNLQYGGSERLASFLAYSVDRKKFETSVLGLYGGGPLTDELDEHGVSYHFLKHSNKFDLRFGLQMNFFSFLLKNPVDILQVHGSYPFTRIVPATILTRTSVIYTVHSKWSLQTTSRLRTMIKLGSHAASKIVVVSYDLRDYLVSEVRLPSHKIIVIHNGVDLNKFDADINPKEVPGLPPHPSDFILIGVIGRLNEAKDHIGLLKAWAKISRVKQGLRLVIVGDGKLRVTLQNMVTEFGIADSVIFLGQLDDIPSIIARMDLMLLPSKREGFPISILEYMAMGKPVIATRVGGVPEIIKHGYNGILVSPEDPDSLSQAILGYLENRKLFKKLADNGKKTVEERFSTIPLLKKYESLYKDICNRKL